MNVPVSQTCPVPHVPPTQHIWPVYPHGTHIPPTQLFGCSHGYGKCAGSVQQIPPRAPHGMHVPPEHVVPPTQSMPTPPGQHACPEPPHA
jgi:hypothetical protein